MIVKALERFVQDYTQRYEADSETPERREQWKQWVEGTASQLTVGMEEESDRFDDAPIVPEYRDEFVISQTDRTPQTLAILCKNTSTS